MYPSAVEIGRDRRGMIAWARDSDGTVWRAERPWEARARNLAGRKRVLGVAVGCAVVAFAASPASSLACYRPVTHTAVNRTYDPVRPATVRPVPVRPAPVPVRADPVQPAPVRQATAPAPAPVVRTAAASQPVVGSSAAIQSAFGPQGPGAVAWANRVSACESGGSATAQNPSGATGLFQFMPSTWASTPQGQAGMSPTDPNASAQAAAWMYSQGRQSAWSCS